MSDVLIKAADVAEMLSLNIKTFYGFLKRPAGADFPKPIMLGERTMRWRKADVEGWMKSKAQ